MNGTSQDWQANVAEAAQAVDSGTLKKIMGSSYSQPVAPQIVEPAVDLFTDNHPFSERVRAYSNHKRDWFIQDLWSKGSIGVLHALEGSFKSFLVYLMAEDLALGQSFLGVFPTMKPRSIGIYQSELGEQSTVARLAGMYPDGRLPKNLHLSDGEEKLQQTVKGSATVRQMFDRLAEWYDRQAMEGLIIDHMGDFLRKTGKPIHSEEATLEVVDIAGQTLPKGTNLLFVRHDGKPGKDTENRDSNQRVRGSNSLVENASLVLGMSRERRPKPSHKVTLTFGKTRDCEEPPNIDLWFDKGTCRLTQLPPVIAVLLKGPLTREEILAACKLRFDLGSTKVSQMLVQYRDILREEQQGHKRVFKLDFCNLTEKIANLENDETDNGLWIQSLANLQP